MADTIAREVFGLLFETSTEAVFIVDRTTQCIVSANVRAADMLARDVDALVGMSLATLSFEPERDLMMPGHYEDVALRRGDDYPVYVELNAVHVTTERGELAAYTARDTSERRLLERELVAKHSALYAAYADLAKAHAELKETKAELESRNREIAMLAWSSAMGELVAGIAHHLNNPVGALASTTRRLIMVVGQVQCEQRPELDRLLTRVATISRRIESNVSAILEASRTNAHHGAGKSAPRELPPELQSVLSRFTEQMDDIPTKEQT